MLVDPTEKEEAVMDGTMVMAMNVHREICTVQMSGGMLLLKDQVRRRLYFVIVRYQICRNYEAHIYPCAKVILCVLLSA